MICVNCKKEYTGEYCKYCGMPSGVDLKKEKECNSKWIDFSQGYVSFFKVNVPIFAIRILLFIFVTFFFFSMVELISWFRLISWGIDDMPILMIRMMYSFGFSIFLSFIEREYNRKINSLS